MMTVRGFILFIAATISCACGAPVKTTVADRHVPVSLPSGELRVEPATILSPRSDEAAAMLKYRGDAVFVDGDMVYRSASAGLVIGELADGGTEFQERGAVYTQDASTDVVVFEHHAFVASGPRGVTIVDVSRASAPEVVSSIATRGASMRFDMDGPRLLVAQGGAGVSLIDITRPREPSLLGEWRSEGYVHHAVIHGDAIYVAEGHAGVSKLRITRAGLELVWRHDTKGQARALRVNGDKLFVADGPEGLLVLDVAGDPVELGHLPLDDMARDVLISDDGRRAFVAAGDDGIIVVSTEKPEALEKTGEFVPQRPTNRIRQGSDGRIFVGNDSDGLLILDVRSPDEPVKIFPPSK